MSIINLETKSQRIACIERNGYVARAQRYSILKADNIVANIGQSSHVPKVNVRDVLLGVQQAIAYFVVNGHSVNLSKFGKLFP